MKIVRNTFYLLFAFILLFGVPIGAFAQSSTYQNEQPSKTVNDSIKQNTKPYLDKIGNQNYLNPGDYPLMQNGQSLSPLHDSVGSYHYLTYMSTSDYSDTKLQVLLRHGNDDSSQDSYLNVEFYTNNNGNMSYLGSFTTNVGEAGGTLDLGISVDKSLYENDPYIYMRVGILRSVSDTYYSAATYFKVTNPFFQESTQQSDSQYYELISNESTESSQVESAGSFQINNDQYAYSKNINKSAYKLDYVVPFDAEKYQDNTVKRSERSIQANYQTGDSKSFYVQNTDTGAYSTINATLLYSGTHANVWVNNNEINADQAALLGKEFDSRIYPLDVNNFGNPSDVDHNGKVNILCYDIQDGFSGYGGYVAGYFDPKDLYTTSYSNQSEIFYIDTYPLMGMSSSKDVSEAYSTLAHEFQHMINFNQKVLVQGNYETDTWMDEGLAMAAEQIYSGAALQDRIDYYNNDTDITNGHSLLYWDYYGDTLANYSLSYLFMEYLKDQCGQGDGIFKELINDPHNDYLAVQDLIHKYINPNLTFGQFMTAFRAALVLKESSGLYGFKGDKNFDSVKVKPYSGSALNLKGGGAVIRNLSSKESFSVPQDKGQDVTYTLLSKGSEIPTKPLVHSVGDKDTYVSGTADPNNTIIITVNGTNIGTGVVSTTGSFNIKIPSQKAGTKLHIYATDAKGNKSGETLITVYDNTPPGAPIINGVSDQDTSVTGKAEAYSTVSIMVNGNLLRSGAAKADGTFIISISKQKAGTRLVIFAEDASHNKSAGTTVTVMDKTPPAKPKVGVVSDATTTVTGTSEANAFITIKRGSTKIGSGKASSKGSFAIKIAKQKAGTVLTIYAEDASHNKSVGTTVTVMDKTPPAKPKVGVVSDATTTVTGTSEANAFITVKRGSTKIGSGKANSKGSFIIKIAKQKAGTVLTIYAEDASHNKSATALKVIDKTAPSRPIVSSFGDNQSMIVGKAEPGSIVTIKKGKIILGKATANSKGAFKVRIKSRQKAGTTLTAYTTDKAGNQSKGKAFKVVDKTHPSVPTASKITTKSTSISGKAEKGARVYLYHGSKCIGKTTADSKGKYKMKISKQKKGASLKLYAQDKAKNKSKYKYLKVY